jgi:hypothetical protein
MQYLDSLQEMNATKPQDPALPAALHAAPATNDDTAPQDATLSAPADSKEPTPSSLVAAAEELPKQSEDQGAMGFSLSSIHVQVHPTGEAY